MILKVEVQIDSCFLNFIKLFVHLFKKKFIESFESCRKAQIFTIVYLNWLQTFSGNFYYSRDFFLEAPSVLC